jgi:AcrR family transcriptional regulator
MGQAVIVDRRITRTKLAIRNAMVSLIEEKGFDDLSVSEIAIQANINRGTFYSHYRDKYDLLEQTVAEILQDIEKIFLKAKALNVADFMHRDQPLPITVEIFDYLKENEAIMRVVFGLGGDIAFQVRLRKVVENTLKLGFLAGLDEEDFQVPREYLISYILHAHFGVIQSWLANGCKESPIKMAHILSRLSFDGPLRATGIDQKNP